MEKEDGADPVLCEAILRAEVARLAEFGAFRAAHSALVGAIRSMALPVGGNVSHGGWSWVDVVVDLVQLELVEVPKESEYE